MNEPIPSNESVEPATEGAPPDRRKHIAIAINVLLFLGIIGFIVLRASGTSDETTVTAATTTSTTTEVDTAEDDSLAFVTGIQRVTTTTTTTTSTTTTSTTTTTTTSTTTTTLPEEPPVLSGELDDDGIPVGLEFPLFNSQHTIIGGENLWLIAANQLAAITDRTLEEVPEVDIARYWERVIETNRGDLVSGDPNLVFPGEVITFPGA